jgi:SAM-dependent methyltransferase
MSRVEQDPYIQSAEIYDILAEPHWAARRPSFAEALRRMMPCGAGLVLDVGAGTGQCVQSIADTLPQARIHAVEPSVSMRVGLMTRVLADADLRRRVTVHPSTFEDALLPNNFDGALICGCIGYFDKPARARLWKRVAACLAPSGAVLVDVMPVQEPCEVPEARVASTRVGDHRYDVWLRGTPAGRADLMRWDMCFEQFEGEACVRRVSIQREWHAFGLAQLLREAAHAGFESETLADSPVPAALLRLRAARPAPPTSPHKA